MKSNSIKIVIVDDNESFRSAMKQFLEIELGHKVIGEAENGQQFLELKEAHFADIVLMDLNIPVLDGYKTTLQWIWINPQAKVIAVTMFTEKAYLKSLVESGFKGCVIKSNLYSELDKAIKAVMNKKMYFDLSLKFD